MITQTHEPNGVKYGLEWTNKGDGFMSPSYFKQISASNKAEPQWVGVSAEEWELSKKGFERGDR